MTFVWYIRLFRVLFIRGETRRRAGLRAISMKAKPEMVRRLAGIHLANCHIRKGEFRRANALLERIREVHETPCIRDTNASALIIDDMFALVRYELGDYEGAWKIVSRLSDGSEDGPRTLAFAVKVALTCGHVSDAECLIERLLVAYKRRGPQLARREGVRLERAGKHEEAKLIYQAIVEREPHHVDALTGLVRTHVNTGSRECARVYARRLMRIRKFRRWLARESQEQANRRFRELLEGDD